MLSVQKFSISDNLPSIPPADGEGAQPDVIAGELKQAWCLLPLEIDTLLLTIFIDASKTPSVGEIIVNVESPNLLRSLNHPLTAIFTAGGGYIHSTGLHPQQNASNISSTRGF